MSFERIIPPLWMQLEQSMRNYLAKEFELSRTGISEIKDQELISDGYCLEDLSTITAAKMTAFVGSEETFPRLWELTCMKARSVLNPPIGIIKKLEDKTEDHEEEKPKRRQAKQGGAKEDSEAAGETSAQ